MVLSQNPQMAPLRVLRRLDEVRGECPQIEVSSPHGLGMALYIRRLLRRPALEEKQYSLSAATRCVQKLELGDEVRGTKYPTNQLEDYSYPE